MKLVANAKDAWRWASMHAMGWAAAILVAYTSIPVQFQARIPDWIVNSIIVAVLLLGMVGRLVDQSKEPK